MSKKQIMLAVVTVITVVLIYIGAQAYNFYKTPLGPALILGPKTIVGFPTAAQVTEAASPIQLLPSRQS